MRKWIRRHPYLTALLGVALAVVLLVGLRDRRPVVEVATARVDRLVMRLAASGLVEGESADLGFLDGGRLVGVYVQEGQRVGRSELLARAMPLRLAPGALGVGDVIQAPYDGTVVTIYERTGAVVSPGQPVLRLVAAHAPWVTVFVEAEDAALLRPGQRLQCRAGGYLSRAWELRVEQVGREAVPRPDLPGSARQVRVRCAVLEPAFPLAPGAEVDVDGSLPVLDSALLLPATAVVHEGEEEWVWLVDEQGAVRRRPVRLGPNNFELIQIREGLQPGETVVVHGKEGLEEGQRVRAVEAEEGARRGEGAGAR